MGVSFGRARVADSSFQVYERALHPDWFATREFGRERRSGWDASLRIIEGGHAVVFRAGAAPITEVLAGPETVLPEAGRLLQWPLRRERTIELRPKDAIEYQSCIEVERVGPEIFFHLCEEIALEAERAPLFHRFRSVNRLAPSPISHVRYEARAGGLLVQSFHSFPEELAIVRTQSLFEPRAAGRRN